MSAPSTSAVVRPRCRSGLLHSSPSKATRDLLTANLEGWRLKHQPAVREREKSFQVLTHIVWKESPFNAVHHKPFLLMHSVGSEVGGITQKRSLHLVGRSPLLRGRSKVGAVRPHDLSSHVSSGVIDEVADRRRAEIGCGEIGRAPSELQSP